MLTGEEENVEVADTCGEYRLHGEKDEVKLETTFVRTVGGGCDSFLEESPC